MTKHLGNTLLAVRPLLPAVALAGLLACSRTGGPRASHPRPATTVNETTVTTVPEPTASEPGALGDQLAALLQLNQVRHDDVGHSAAILDLIDDFLRHFCGMVIPQVSIDAHC